MKVSTPGKQYTGPSQARLNNAPSEKGAGAWVPNSESVEDCLVVQFNKVEHVKEIRTQGHPYKRMYAKRYLLYSSMDGKKYDEVARKVKAFKLYIYDILGNNLILLPFYFQLIM